MPSRLPEDCRLPHPPEEMRLVGENPETEPRARERLKTMATAVAEMMKLLLF
jgi:hypothetical protein